MGNKAWVYTHFPTVEERRAYYRERYQTINKPHMLKYNKAHREENNQRAKEYWHEVVKSDPERLAQYRLKDAQRKKANKEHYKAWRAAYMADPINRERSNRLQRERRARKKAENERP